MDGVHDLGGMQNLGPVEREESPEPVFHAEWEGLVFAYTLAGLGAGYFKIDELRRSNESMPPVSYLAARYYEKWLFALESILMEKNVLTPEELTGGRSLRNDGFALPPVSLKKALYALTNPMPARLAIEVRPRFRPGDDIVARNMTPRHHTRLPRYIRGRRGTVEEDHGVFTLPDTNAHGGPKRPQHVYSVRFAAREVWGDQAPPRDSVHVDLFDDYMDRV